MRSFPEWELTSFGNAELLAGKMYAQPSFLPFPTSLPETLLEFKVFGLGWIWFGDS